MGTLVPLKKAVLLMRLHQTQCLHLFINLLKKNPLQQALLQAESLNDFNKLHGNHITPLKRRCFCNCWNKHRAPHTMKGQNLVFFEPSLDYGLVSFTKGSTFF